MHRMLLLPLALVLALPTAAMADDGGMAARGEQAGGMAAPVEPPPAAVEAPVTVPPSQSEPRPPADIGPYGPNHEPPPQATGSPAPALREPAPEDSSPPLSADAVPARPVTRAAEFSTPSGLVGAAGPGDGVGARDGGGGSALAWLLIALAGGALVASGSALLARRAGDRAAATRAATQGLHRFA